MPRESRAFVKAGLIYLLATFLAGAVMLVFEAIGRPAPYIFGVEHAHLGSVGWLVNIVIGIALWMLPLNRERFPQTKGRYPAAAPWTCFWLLNCGLIMRVAGEPWFQLGAKPAAASILLVASAAAQLGAVAVFVMIAWHRVRGVTVR